MHARSSFSGGCLKHAERPRIAADIAQLLSGSPGLTKEQVLAGLRPMGWTHLSAGEVYVVLYSEKTTFACTVDVPPLWSLRVAAAAPAAGIAADDSATGHALVARCVAPPLRAWQEEALAAWRAAGSVGVVEAVTGSGKTAVGVAAAAHMIASGGRVLILVPGLDLLQQWFAILHRQLPNALVGRLGDGFNDTLARHDLVVSTVHSARGADLLPDGRQGLLVADEVHRYGADCFAEALDPRFRERLGLTATYERDDDGLAQNLEPYFRPTAGSHPDGEVVFRCDYARGLADDILAPFRVGLLGVDLEPAELARYEQLDETARSTRRDLVNIHGVRAEPFGEFMQAVVALSDGDDDSVSMWCARKYLSAFSKRRSLLADSRRKLEALRIIAPAIASAKGSLVFTETMLSAQAAAAELRAQDVDCLDYTSDLKRHERKERLDWFRGGHLKALAAPRVLDEGVDVPEAEIGVIMAASRSRRQMIQRMGRIIRPKEHGGAASFIVMYARGTSEDPANGAHGAFLEMLTGNADEVAHFPTSVTADYLKEWHAG